MPPKQITLTQMRRNGGRGGGSIGGVGRGSGNGGRGGGSIGGVGRGSGNGGRGGGSNGGVGRGSGNGGRGGGSNGGVGRGSGNGGRGDGSNGGEGCGVQNNNEGTVRGRGGRGRGRNSGVVRGGGGRGRGRSAGRVQRMARSIIRNTQKERKRREYRRRELQAVKSVPFTQFGGRFSQGLRKITHLNRCHGCGVRFENPEALAVHKNLVNRLRGCTKCGIPRFTSIQLQKAHIFLHWKRSIGSEVKVNHVDPNQRRRFTIFLHDFMIEQDSANGIKTLSRPPVPVGVLECLHQGDSFYLYESHDMPRASIFPTSHRFLCTNNETSCKAEFITCKIGHLNYESVATKTSLWVNREHNHLPQHRYHIRFRGTNAEVVYYKDRGYKVIQSCPEYSKYKCEGCDRVYIFGEIIGQNVVWTRTGTHDGGCEKLLFY